MFSKVTSLRSKAVTSSKGTWEVMTSSPFRPQKILLKMGEKCEKIYIPTKSGRVYFFIQLKRFHLKFGRGGSYPIWDTPEFKLKFTMSMKWVYAMFNSIIQKHAACVQHSAFQAPESASLQPRPAQKLTNHLHFSAEVFHTTQPTNPTNHTTILDKKNKNGWWLTC